jgi:N-acyl-D-aspartate/D-glutamate deacylase
MLDLLISGGELVDGTGAVRRRADVGIRNGRIVAVGSIDEPSSRVLDADGQIVAPGFIDVHTHLDVQGFWDQTLSPSPLHGVTSVIGGNCGFTVAPLNEREAGFLMRMLARVEGMPLATLESGVPWDWRSTEEFFARIPPLSINAGFKVGHSAVRRVAMGEEASTRQATEAEIREMQQLVRESLSAGALGFSSTWSPTHNDDAGNPVPSRFADTRELVELAGVCRDFPGTSLEFLPQQAVAEFDPRNVDVMTQMSSAAQRPLNWNMLTVSAAALQNALAKLTLADHAQARGGRVVALTLPITIMGRFSFATGFALEALPGWNRLFSLNEEARLASLLDPVERRSLNELSQQNGPFRHIAQWTDKVIAETVSPENKKFEGRLVGDIAREQNKEPFDALLDIVCADQLRTTFTNRPPDETRADWAARVQVWRDKRAVIGASDAGAHLDFLGTFNYTTRLLQVAVREEQAIPLEEAVHLLTEVPAGLYGLRDRGTITPGAFADITVFDEQTVGSEPLSMRKDLPGGAARLYAASTGVSTVVVHGTPIIENGEFNDARPGTLFHAGRDTVTPPLV